MFKFDMSKSTASTKTLLFTGQNHFVKPFVSVLRARK